VLATNATANDPDVVAKSRFAELANVSAPRVSQWITDGKISGEALVGEGRRARIRVSVACAQLKRSLDISQRFGNGITTKLDHPLPDPPESAGVASPAPSPNSPAPLEPIEEQLKREKLEQLQRLNRRAAREEAKKNGRLTDADLARQQMGRVAAQIVTIYDGGATEIANAIASAFNLPPRDVVHLLRSEFRKVRAAAAKALRRGIDDVPLIAEIDVGEEAGEVADRGCWDLEMLRLELKDLSGLGADLSTLGFTSEELAVALAPGISA